MRAGWRNTSSTDGRAWFELVDVEYVKEAGTWYLRAYIDKEAGLRG